MELPPQGNRPLHKRAGIHQKQRRSEEHPGSEKKLDYARTLQAEGKTELEDWTQKDSRKEERNEENRHHQEQMIYFQIKIHQASYY